MVNKGRSMVGLGETKEAHPPPGQRQAQTGTSQGQFLIAISAPPTMVRFNEFSLRAQVNQH
jgi:hypothetical protein